MNQNKFKLTTPVSQLDGVLKEEARHLQMLGIRCLSDLILHKPLRYEHIKKFTSLEENLNNNKEKYLILAEVISARPIRSKIPRTTATFSFNGIEINVTWFYQKWVIKHLNPGNIIALEGTVQFKKNLEMTNPKIYSKELFIDKPIHQIIPIYPGSEKISTEKIRSIIQKNLIYVPNLIKEHLPQSILKKKNFPTLSNSLINMHIPKDNVSLKSAYTRLAYDDLFFSQIAVSIKRHKRNYQEEALPLTIDPNLHKKILNLFSFKPTKGQLKAIEEVKKDLKRVSPMNRLLQGDVGCGKTTVAFYSILMAISNKTQAAVMAPTTLLANQHFNTLQLMLKNSNVAIALIDSSTKESIKNQILNKLESGEIDIIIGTHSLLNETIKYKNLSLAVIDEQHRFGTEQRLTFRKTKNISLKKPHVLVMTATPIPRSLAMTYFGDLDISTIKEMPPGRQIINTIHLAFSELSTIFKTIEKNLTNGDLVYFVVPAIDNETVNGTNLYEIAKLLQSSELAKYGIVTTHGQQLSKDQKESLESFRKGLKKILIATTVIEVGIDIPEASMMIILDAERYGLAQIHQLRGRIGRGSKESTCWLVSNSKNEAAQQRLNCIINSQDGFKIAEEDLRMRGSGDLSGIRQSGDPSFKFASIPEHVDLLQEAKADAIDLISKDPALESDKYELLKSRMLKACRHSIDITDVA